MIFSTSIYAQVKKGVSIKTSFLKSINLDFKIKAYTFDFNNIDFSKSNLIFSSFNKTTNLNDIYLVKDNDLIYSRSNNLYGSTHIKSALVFVNTFLK